MALQPAPPSARLAHAWPPLERRIGADGAPYSAAQFQAFHGKGWESHWLVAPTELRFCASGRLVSRAELVRTMGAIEGRRAWRQAVPVDERRLLQAAPLSFKDFLDCAGRERGRELWARAATAEPGVSASLWAALLQQTAVRVGQVALLRGGPDECARLRAFWAYAPDPGERARLRAVLARADRGRRQAAPAAAPDASADDAGVPGGWMESLAEAVEAAEASGRLPPRRIARDGAARTAAEFMEIYGAGWLEAWGDAALQERVDARGRAGDFDDFVEWYGAQDAPAQWEHSVGAHVRKYAGDGKAYGLLDFIEAFGLEQGQRHWWRAQSVPPGTSDAVWGRGHQRRAQSAHSAQARRPDLRAPCHQEAEHRAPDGGPLPDVPEPSSQEAERSPFDGSSPAESQDAPAPDGGRKGCHGSSPSELREARQQDVEQKQSDGSHSLEAWIGDESGVGPGSVDAGGPREWLEFGSDLEHILFLERENSRLRREIKALRQR